MDTDQKSRLIELLKSSPPEDETLEFKENNPDPGAIGKLISAISNSAAYLGKLEGVVVWGMRDAPRELVGTSFDPDLAKQGNQPLKIYLSSGLCPCVEFHFDAFEHEDKRVVVLRIPAAESCPVSFCSVRYCRVGEACTPLASRPDIERGIWSNLDRTPFDQRGAISGLSVEEVLRRLNDSRYFDLLKRSRPADSNGIIQHFIDEQLVRARSGSFEVSNAAVILLAKSLNEYNRLARKAIRVMVYAGNGRERIERQKIFEKGYAASFEEAIEYVEVSVPVNTHISGAIRHETPLYPPIALRELIANAIIHQDFLISGAGPLIEIFNNRIEILNPGAPLADPDRFLDTPPKSRNERLAALMRRMGMCEEAGSGIDRVLASVEMFQLPPPKFERVGDAVRVTLFAPAKYRAMRSEDRVRACYQHAGLKFILGDRMTNASLRIRFGLDEPMYTQVSKVISDTVEQGLIRRDPPNDRSRRHARYIPFWA